MGLVSWHWLLIELAALKGTYLRLFMKFNSTFPDCLLQPCVRGVKNHCFDSLPASQRR